jgi:hypothetical protein
VSLKVSGTQEKELWVSLLLPHGSYVLSDTLLLTMLLDSTSILLWTSGYCWFCT